ncbi:MAG: malate dehydrogenase [Sporichthyaceae bacterium]
MAVIGAEQIDEAKKNGGVLRVKRGDLITPLARERAFDVGVKIEQEAPLPPKRAPELVVPINKLAQNPPRSTRPPTTGAAPPAPAIESAPTPAAPAKAPANAPSLAGPSRPDAPTVNHLYRRGAPAPALPKLGGSRTGRPRAAVVGAGHVGAVAAMRLAESDLFEEVVLTDIVEGLAAGIALDLWHGIGLCGSSTRVTGADSVDGVAGCDYVIVTAGKPRKPGMSRTDLTNVNAEIVGSVCERIKAVAPNAVVVVVSNPLEEMTHVARLKLGFPAERVLGMAGVLDTARFCSLVGLTGKVRPDEVVAYALGSHGPEMVVPLSLATAGGKPIRSVLDAATLEGIVQRTRDAGAEVVALLKTGSAYFSPGQSAALMVITMAKDDRSQILACAVEPNGKYGLKDTRVGLPVRLGRGGLVEIVELPMEPAELEALGKAAAALGERLRQLGAEAVS